METTISKEERSIYKILDDLCEAYCSWKEEIKFNYAQLNKSLGEITAESESGYIFSNVSPARLFSETSIGIPSALMDYVEQHMPEIIVETEMICETIPFKSFKYAGYTFVVG